MWLVRGWKEVGSSIAICLFLVTVWPNRAPSGFVTMDAWQHAREMRRGINVLYNDPIWRDPKKALFQERNLADIRQAGFTTVRVNLRAFDHMKRNDVLDGQWLSTLDWVIESATRQGLNVILDEHDYETCGRDVKTCRTKLSAFWRQVAPRYKDAPATVLFELLNEPNGQLDSDAWNNELVRLLKIVRKSNPTRNIVIGPADWNSLDALQRLALPKEDAHIIVTVHYYEPQEFTHQGASWLPHITFPTGVTWGTDADRQAIEQDFDSIAEWSKAQDRPIFIGEFGAYNKADMASRAAYTAAVARAADARGWPWAYWQFDDDFEAYDIKRQQWVRPILRALIP
jgi:endoglucanase